MMVLAASISKTQAVWAVGSGNGGLDTGAIAFSTWYHVYLIERPDTGVVDICFSLSAAAPTLGPNIPAAYTLSRRIGSLFSGTVGVGGQWVPFVQVGDEFIWTASVNDVNTATLSTTSTLFTLTVPTGVQVNTLSRASVASGTAGVNVLIQPPDQATEAVNAVPGDASITVINTTTSNRIPLNIRTNTSAQIRAVASAAATTFQVTTYGWIDRRGRDA
jgi:hypothetical protein